MPDEAKSYAEMRRLLSPEGIAELQNKMEPLKIVQGLQPFEDGKKSQDAIEQYPVQDRAIKQINSIVGYNKDQTLFTLAALYGTLAIPFDITRQFQLSDWGADAQLLKLGLPFPVFDDIPGWTHTIESVDNEHWERFVQFMGELLFKKGENYWSVCGDRIQIPLFGGGYMPIAVFTPRNMLKRIRPYLDGAGIIRLSISDTSDGLVQNNYSRKINLLMEDKGCTLP